MQLESQRPDFDLCGHYAPEFWHGNPTSCRDRECVEDFLPTANSKLICVALFAVVARTDNSKCGLCAVTSAYSTDMRPSVNAVERLTHYSSDELPQEAPHDIPSKKPPVTWPERGEIVFDEIEMAYRPELPSVLKKM